MRPDDTDYVALLEGRVDQLEREVRLLQRKVRAQDADRFETIKNAVEEVLQGKRMSVLFDGFADSTSVVTEAPRQTSSARRSVSKRQVKNEEQNNTIKEETPRVVVRRRQIKSEARSATDYNVTAAPPPKRLRRKTEPVRSFASIKSEQTPTQNGKSRKSAVCKSETPRSRCEYVLLMSFDSADECNKYMKSDVDCRLRSRRPGSGGQGVKVSYACRKEATCPFRKYTLCHDKGGHVDLFVTPEEHNHPTFPFGIPTEARDLIASAVGEGPMDLAEINGKLVENGFEVVETPLLENFIATLTDSN